MHSINKTYKFLFEKKKRGVTETRACIMKKKKIKIVCVGVCWIVFYHTINQYSINNLTYFEI